MLPGAVGVRQALSADFIEVLNVDIDIVITVAVIAAVIIPVVMVMIPVIVIIPVDAAEDGIGCGDASMKPKPFYEAVAKLLPGVGGDRWADRRRLAIP